MPRKLGVYICSGCSIGEAIDTEQLAKVARGEYKIQATKVHPFLCGAEGVALISADLASQSIDTPVIAACSSRAKTSAFSFNHGAVVERRRRPSIVRPPALQVLAPSSVT